MGKSLNRCFSLYEQTPSFQVERTPSRYQSASAHDVIRKFITDIRANSWWFMARTQSADPCDRMGVYTELNDVPADRRLERYDAEYAGRDTYDRFLTDNLFEKFDSDRFQDNCRLAGRRWKSHMEERGRHHALARPSDIETWMHNLLDRVTLNTAYNTYWTKLERFYTWLQHHTDHPHVYHPVLMAAANHEAAGVVWEKKLGRREAYHDE